VSSPGALSRRFPLVRVGGLGLVAAAVALAALPAGGDVVQTTQARLEGPVRFAKDSVQVGGTAVPWDQVLTVLRDPGERSIRLPQALRLTNGELWLMRLQGFAAGKFKGRFMIFGEKTLDAALVQAVDFLPDLAPPAPELKPGALYREKGEPIPGALLWIDEDRLAIDSPLGVLTLQREGTTRYLLKESPKRGAPAAGDEITLADGSLFRGTAKAVKDGVELEHSVLGTLTVAPQALRSVLRRPATAAYLADLAPHAVEGVPLVAHPAAPETVAYPEREKGRAWPGELCCLRGIRIEPKTRVRYRLPATGGRKLVFRTTLSPFDDSRGDVRVRIVAGGKPLLERDLAPGAKAEAASLDVPMGAELAVDVDFGPRIRFPCGVLLADPHVVMQN